MDRRIWKYTLGDRRNRISMPIGAEIVHVRQQHGDPNLWAIVEGEIRPGQVVETENREFHVVPTGRTWPAGPKGSTYHGTVHIGALVFHIIEV